MGIYVEISIRSGMNELWEKTQNPELHQRWDLRFTQIPLGRETVTWIRNFETPHPRRLDAYMIYSEERGCIVDYLGTHEHLPMIIESGT